MDKQKTKAIFLTWFGQVPVDDLQDMVYHLREFTQMPIHIFCDREPPNGVKDNCTVKVIEDPIFKDHERAGYRNANYYRFKAIATSPYEACAYFDLDMRIVHEGWLEGFDLAKTFGLCLPISGRSFTLIDDVLGSDPAGARLPHYATSYCTSPIFARKFSRNIVALACQLMVKEPARGPSIIARAIAESRKPVYTLCQEWCYCDDKDRYLYGTTFRIWPIIVHCNTPERTEFYEKTRKLWKEENG